MFNIMINHKVSPSLGYSYYRFAFSLSLPQKSEMTVQKVTLCDASKLSK